MESLSVEHSGNRERGRVVWWDAKALSLFKASLKTFEKALKAQINFPIIFVFFHALDSPNFFSI